MEDRSLAMLEDTPCLVLLGEPGMGKTTELRALWDSLKIGGAKSIWVDGREYGDEVRLVGDTFEISRFKEWLSGSGILYLLIDSLDEARQRIHQVDSLLVGELGRHQAHLHRLRLRIACRATEWMEFTEDGLRDLWGADSVRVCTLAPLAEDDVAIAAQAEDIDPKAFLQAAMRKGILPLATRPITLSLMLKMYEQGKRLPGTQVELYEKGCLKLCDEASPSRRAAGIVGGLSAEQRLAAASRIAAVLVLCGRAGLYMGPVLGENPDEDLTTGELEGGVESYGRGSVEVSVRNISEVVKVGLFDSAGPTRVRFSHQTFAEFLAARYLLRHCLPSDRILQLLRHSKEEAVVPQLRGVAAWLASMDRGLFQTLQSSEAPTIILGDIEAMSDGDKCTLLEGLLTQLSEGSIRGVTPNLRPHFHKLQCPGLARPLGRWLKDKTQSIDARVAALQIARECGVTALRSAMVDLVLDSSERLELRIKAIDALREIEDERTLRRLRPIALGVDEGDPHDELKGRALEILWPRKFIKARELFESLSPPKCPQLIGGYRMFVAHTLAGHLASEDILSALKWAAQHGRQGVLPRAFEELLDGILTEASRCLHQEGVLEATAEVMAWRLSQGGGRRLTLRKANHPDWDDKRRELVTAILRRVAADERRIFSLADPPVLLSGADFPWLLEQAEAAAAEGEAKAWARLARFVFVLCRPDIPQSLRAAAKESMVIRQEFKEMLGREECGSQAGAEPGAGLDVDTVSGRAPEEDASRRAERVLHWLQEFEDGDSSAWWRLNGEMLAWCRMSGLVDLEPDLRRSPGWLEAKETTRARILRAAKEYVLDGNAEPQKWLGAGTFYHPAAAGYRALLLLHHESPDEVDALAPGTWRRWASIVVAYPSVGERDLSEQCLVSLAYKNAAAEVLGVLLAELDHESAAGGLACLQWMPRGRDDGLCKGLLERVRRGDLRPERQRDLLSKLIERGCTEARRVAASSLNDAQARRNREMTIAMAVTLMVSTPDAGWQAVWPIIKNNSDLGREVLVRLGRSLAGGNDLGQRLTVDQAGALFTWMVKSLPETFNLEIPRADALAESAPLSRIRDSLITRLVSSGSWEAIAILKRAGKEKWLAWLNESLPAATEAALRCTWSPMAPRKLLAIVLEGEPVLTPAQDEESSEFGYKSRIPVRVPGKLDSKGRNVVGVGDDEVVLGDRTFGLLCCLIAENARGRGGWIKKKALVVRDVLSPDAENGVKRLRDALGQNGRLLIEGDGRGRIRVSAHPTLIRMDLDSLVRHREPRITRLVRRMQRSPKAANTSRA